MKHETFTFTEREIDKVFHKLTASDHDLRTQFLKETDDADDSTGRLYYLEMSVISQYIVSKVKEGATETLSDFFANVEEVLNSCDAYVQNLIVIGLFEGIQNAAGNRINYYSDFNQWLQPKSRLNWDALIDSWEGNEWRTIKK